MATSRTTPTNVAIAPIFGFLEKAFTSNPASKSSLWTEIFTSTPGNRGEERNLVARLDRRSGLSHLLVHGNPDQLLLRKYGFPGLAARHEMRAQARDAGDAGRHLDLLRVLAELLLHAGKEANGQLHPSFTCTAPSTAESEPFRPCGSPG